MALSTLCARVDTEDKAKFEEFCAETGMNVTTAINMFIKAVLREKKLPFEISSIRIGAAASDTPKKEHKRRFRRTLNIAEAEINE